MNKYIVKSEGRWNTPYIDSNILRLRISGYKPVFSGGCMGIIPYENNTKYMLLNEDDDYYFDNASITKDELTILKNIIQQLSQDIKVKICYDIWECNYYPELKNIGLT